MLNGSVGSSCSLLRHSMAISRNGLLEFLLERFQFCQGNVVARTLGELYRFVLQSHGKRHPADREPRPAMEPHTLRDHLGDPIHFEKEWFDKGIKSTVFKMLAGLEYTGDALYLGFNTDVENSWLKFAPRLGWPGREWRW